MSSSAIKKAYLNWVFWFFVGNAILFWVIGLHYFAVILPFHLSTSTVVNQFIAWLFLLSAYFGQLGLFAILAAALPTLLVFIYPKKYLIFTSALISAFLIAWLLCLDTFVFSQYRFHLNGILWNLVTSGQATEIFDLSWLEWLATGLLSLLLLGLEIGLALLIWKKYNNKPFRSKYPLSLVGCLLGSYYMLALIVPFSGSLSLNQQAYTIPLYYEVLAKFLPGNRLPALESLYRPDFVEINHTNAKLHYPLHPLIYKTTQKPLNIVFILIDTWRFDMMNAVNTPNIYRFAQESWQFQQHFSGGNGTQPGIFSLFYSLPASYWTATINEHKSPVFINKLLDEGYHTGVFASATLLAPAFNQNVFSKIKNLQTTTPGDLPPDRDKRITSEFKQFVSHTSSPFFSFLFYDAAHSFCYGNSPDNPFQPSIGVCDRLTYTNHTDPTPTFNRYKNALYYIDELVGQDLALLKKQHLLDNTIVVITGDHGNEFNDNHLGYWGHASNFTHYQTQTPLIIHWPGQKPAVIKHRTTHYDIVPTFLKRLFGCQNPTDDYSIGQSLFDKKKRPYLLLHSYTNLGIIKDKHIISIYPSGYFQVQDMHAKILTNDKLPMETILSALSQTKRYYTTQ